MFFCTLFLSRLSNKFLNQLIDIKSSINYCCTIQLAVNFLRYFVSQIITFFCVSVSLFEEDSEIDKFLDSFVIHACFDYISMAVILFFNSAIVKKVS